MTHTRDGHPVIHRGSERGDIPERMIVMVGYCGEMS